MSTRPASKATFDSRLGTTVLCAPDRFSVKSAILWYIVIAARRAACYAARVLVEEDPGCFFMLLLYLDESGSFDKDREHSVLGGVAIHVADIDDFRDQVEKIICGWIDEHNRHLELHATAMRTGSKVWRKIPQDTRHGLLRALLELLGSFQSRTGHGFALFAVVRKPRSIPGVDPLERSLEELLFRFRSMLDRLSGSGEPQFGVVVADEAKHEQVVQPLVVRWRDTGTRRRWMGRLDRIVEVPLFVDSKTTRLLQMADIVAHSVYQFYENQDGSWIGPMLPAFDTDEGVMHGLVHLCDTYRRCACPACVSRMARDRQRLQRVKASREEDQAGWALFGDLLPGLANDEDE
jgi:hypothetical protein